ncbi:hypothetical protein RFI_25491 [Reticulomyxa filosa]|uniref:CAP-Gly domain-containing protein n=1 Tax=Reticulomyxa filosa TaxID=46433 RepID=X6MDF4_RETFI|nr:hypothetical protein RFI_25491 [Reticulomyxa filosa]|eukprot:ETO11889.1 hypothetical protein RFI_25491 [Reticulomyxa filosa]
MFQKTQMSEELSAISDRCILTQFTCVCFVLFPFVETAQLLHSQTDDWLLFFEGYEKKGTHNGTFKNKYYFECRPDHGLFVLPTKIGLHMHTNIQTKENSLNVFNIIAYLFVVEQTYFSCAIVSPTIEPENARNVGSAPVPTNNINKANTVTNGNKSPLSPGAQNANKTSAHLKHAIKDTSPMSEDEKEDDNDENNGNHAIEVTDDYVSSDVDNEHATIAGEAQIHKQNIETNKDYQLTNVKYKSKHDPNINHANENNDELQATNGMTQSQEINNKSKDKDKDNTLETGATTQREERMVYTIEDLEAVMSPDRIHKTNGQTETSPKKGDDLPERDFQEDDNNDSDDGDEKQESDDETDTGTTRGVFSSWFKRKKQNKSDTKNGSTTPRHEKLERVAKEYTPLATWITLYDDKDGRTEQLRDEIISTKIKKRKITLKGPLKSLYEANPPLLIDIHRSERENMFRLKLKLCRAVCDFNDMTRVKLEMIKKKEELLADLTEFVSRNTWFSEDMFEECLKTISANLFRSLPYQFRPPSLMFFNDEVFEKETVYEDPTWRHLKLVYDLTWRIINNPDVTAQVMEVSVIEGMSFV